MNINLVKIGSTYDTQRKAYYPWLAEQMDLLFHSIESDLFGEDAKSSSIYLALKAVKDKFPKE